VFANAGPLAWLPVPALQHLVVEQQSLHTMRSFSNLDTYTKQDTMISLQQLESSIGDEGLSNSTYCAEAKPVVLYLQEYVKQTCVLHERSLKMG